MILESELNTGSVILDLFSIMEERTSKRTEIRDLGSKLAAQILLSDDRRRIIIPSKEEMIGVYLLERDDELKRRT